MTSRNWAALFCSLAHKSQGGQGARRLTRCGNNKADAYAPALCFLRSLLSGNGLALFQALLCVALLFLQALFCCALLLVDVPLRVRRIGRLGRGSLSPRALT